jgi:flagellar biogenesis protein FliO
MGGMPQVIGLFMTMVIFSAWWFLRMILSRHHRSFNTSQYVSMIHGHLGHPVI